LIEVLFESEGDGNPFQTLLGRALKESVQSQIKRTLQSLKCPSGCHEPHLKITVSGDLNSGGFRLKGIEACCLAHMAVANDKLLEMQSTQVPNLGRASLA
jgi:hypothetical protein